jgi:hypothetical protein
MTVRLPAVNCAAAHPRIRMIALWAGRQFVTEQDVTSITLGIQHANSVRNRGGSNLTNAIAYIRMLKVPIAVGDATGRRVSIVWNYEITAVDAKQVHLPRSTHYMDYRSLRHELLYVYVVGYGLRNCNASSVHSVLIGKCIDHGFLHRVTTANVNAHSSRPH